MPAEQIQIRYSPLFASDRRDTVKSLKDPAMTEYTLNFGKCSGRKM